MRGYRLVAIALVGLAMAAVLSWYLHSPQKVRRVAPQPQDFPSRLKARLRSGSGHAPISEVRVIRTFPHDPEAFTQGLLFRDGFLYESTGLNGRSSLRKVELATGKVLRKQGLPEQYFAEGLALWHDRLIQLTWTSGVGFVYDLATFELRDEFNYDGEGWGLTQDGQRLIMSDGTPRLRLLNPATLKQTGLVEVRDGDLPIQNLNELEWIDGEVWANIWQTGFVARIDPATGQVKSWLDLSPLRAYLKPTDRTDVINGLAHDPQTRRTFATGKLWPLVFEIEAADEHALSKAATK